MEYLRSAWKTRVESGKKTRESFRSVLQSERKNAQKFVLDALPFEVRVDERQAKAFRENLPFSVVPKSTTPVEKKDSNRDNDSSEVVDVTDADFETLD